MTTRPDVECNISTTGYYKQRFIQALLIMPVLWKKIEFYTRESNHEMIVIAGEVLGRMGGWGGGGGGQAESLPQRQVFPLWVMGPSLPPTFSPLNIVTWNGTLKSKKGIKIWTTEWVTSQGNLKNFLPVVHIFVRISNSWLQKPILSSSSEFLGLDVPSIYWPNPNGKPLQVQGRTLVMFQEAKAKYVSPF